MVPRGPWTDEQREKYRATMAAKKAEQPVTVEVGESAKRRRGRPRKGNGLDIRAAVRTLQSAHERGEVRFVLTKRGALKVEQKQFVEI